MKQSNRALALLLALTLSMGMMSVARAANDNPSVSIAPASFTEVSGNVSMNFFISNTTGGEIQLQAISPGSGSILANVSLVCDDTKSYISIPSGGGWASATGIIKNNVQPNTYSATNGELLTFGFGGGQAAEDYDSYTIKKQAAETTSSPTPTPEDKEAKLRISPVDRYGQVVPAPAGDYGETISIRVPLKCYRSSVYDVKIAPVLSNDIEKYPFDIEAVDYMLSYPNSVAVGDIIEFQYNLRLSKKATTGVKQVDFSLSYRVGADAWGNGGTLETSTVSLFVNVEKGLAPTASDAGGSTPKLIVESYKISSDKIYAGETFKVTITIKNTSASEAIQNLQIRFKDTAEVAKLVPASGGSNAIYISKISKGESKTETISLQTAPDTEAKAYTLGLDFGYEGASNNAAYTAAETIAIPILQKIRIKCDDPTIYDSEAWVGQSCGMYVKLYNMGKSSIYNCMVDVEGEGLAMEESYFGGNIGSGSTMAADFSIIPSVAGEIAGTVVITYEDVYGEPNEERLPFTLTVNEEVSMVDPSMEGMEGMDGMEGGIEVYGPGVEEGGMPWWGWVLCILAAGGLSVGGIMLYRKKRARSLEDV
ncbi:MAG: hypothetical protein VB049_00040 [Candidatus Pelethousia sp.]|nr:hypothetical protein [Candidatus Pelethousia sp.]